MFEVCLLILVGIMAFVFGQMVTDKLVKDGGWWAKRVKGTALRRANFPLGGVLFGVLTAVTGSPWLAMVALGFGLSAIMYRADDNDGNPWASTPEDYGVNELR